MTTEWKINVYEVQVLLYWILSFLILNSPTHGFLRFCGWFALWYGCFTLIVCFGYGFELRIEKKAAKSLGE